MYRLDASGITGCFSGRQGFADCMDAVESARKDEVVIARELCEAISKGAVVDQTAGFVND